MGLTGVLARPWARHRRIAGQGRLTRRRGRAKALGIVVLRS